MSQADIVSYLNDSFENNGEDIYRTMNQRLKELSSLPLTLNMIVGVLKYQNMYPTDMYELYQGFIEYIIGYWETKAVNKYSMYDKMSALVN